MKLSLQSRKHSIIIIITNIICIIVISLIFASYLLTYINNIKEQNVNNIINLNNASAELSQKFFEVRRDSLQDYCAYIKLNNMTLDETMDFLASVNTNTHNTYELISRESIGYCVTNLADGAYYELDYSNKDYSSLHSIFLSAGSQDVGKVDFAPEFTDDYNATKSFGIYTTVPIKSDNNTTEYYTLMMVIRSRDLVNLIQVKGEYDTLSTVLLDNKGNYITSNADYPSDNFFKYIYTANNLTLDEKNELADDFTSSANGELTYNNISNEKCAFIYSKLQLRDWYIVTSVPFSSFENTDFNYFYMLVPIGLVILLFIVDIVWLNTLNRKLKISMEKEKQANNAKTDFLSRMSHDMRTPMNGILGLAKLMKDKAENTDLKTDIEQIQISGQYLLNLINDTLDMNKIEAGKLELHPKPVDSSRVLNNIVSNAKLMAREKNITLTASLPPPANGDKWTPVIMDSSRFEQILMNLISNAIKYTDNDGKVDLIMDTISFTDTEIYDRYIIRDNGIGMSEEFLPHIFDAFTQEGRVNTERQNGTGLGMAIVKQLIDLMGGDISIKSELGKGTEVSLILHYPVYHGEINTQIIDNIPKDFLKGRHILLCEDHPINAQIACRLLSNEGIITDIAENGKIGVEMFEKSENGFYDAILMDIRMPVLNGLDASMEIRGLKREDAKATPIIAMTANAFDDDVQNCLDAGMNAHIAKPIDTQIMFKTIVEEITKAKK